MKNARKSILLIFDFDGTIADTKSVYYQAMRIELGVLGYSDKNIDKAIDIGLSLKNTLKTLGFGFLSRWFLHGRINSQVKTQIQKIKKCRDVDALKSLKGKKVLITNSLREFAIPLLKHLKLEKTFSEIYGAEDFNDKTEFIAEYVKARKMDKRKCYYIGDRVADIKLAKAVKINSIVIAGKCAWDSKAELLKAKPDFILENIGDLKIIV